MQPQWTIKTLPKGAPATAQEIKITSRDLQITLKGKDAERMINSMLNRLNSELKSCLLQDIKEHQQT